VAGNDATPRADRVEALRYAVRAWSESGDSVNAAVAMRRLLDLEPPLVLMLPGVESDAVLRTYYAARQERLQPNGATHAPVRALRLLDFNGLGDPPRGFTSDEWSRIGRAVTGSLQGELTNHPLPGIAILDNSMLEVRGFDVYRYLESPDASRLTRPTHLILGSLAARGDQILITVWLIDAATGEQRARAQRLGRLPEDAFT
jgi:hypothetical protein